jgi:hypothetical protein
MQRMLKKAISATNYLSFTDNKNEAPGSDTQEPGQSKMSAVAFRSQEFCRAELKDFEFDAQFRIVSATIYFSGANFRQVEQGVITSASLKPVRSLMDRCVPWVDRYFRQCKSYGPR